MGCPLWAQAWPVQEALRGRVQNSVSTQMGPCPVALEMLWRKAAATLHTCSALNMEAVGTQAPARKRQRTNYTNPLTVVCTWRSQKQTEMHGAVAQRLPQSSRGQTRQVLEPHSTCLQSLPCHNCYLTLTHAISSKMVRGKYSHRLTLPYLQFQSEKKKV